LQRAEAVPVPTWVLLPFSIFKGFDVTAKT
jgi:hypothetical protein